MKRAAFVFGDTQEGSADFRTLIGVDNDVLAMHGFAEHTAGFEVVQGMRNRPKAEVLAALDGVLGQLSPGDGLLIYFSGHGHGVNGQHVLICQGARLAEIDFFEGVIPVDLLRRKTDRRGLDVAVIVDSCWDTPYVAGTRGGTSQRMSEAEVEYLRNIGLRPVEPSTAGVSGSFSLLCGCSKDHVAVEVPKLRRGLFTAALVTVMKSAVQRRERLQLSEQLCAQVAREMKAVGEAHGLPVIPVPLYSGSGGGLVILDGELAADTAARVAPRGRQELTVSRHGSGHYATIGEALRAAEVGALIRVLPGVYHEGFVIDKPVELVGEGPVDMIVIENDAAPCLISTTDVGTVRGLSFRGTSGGQQTTFSAVQITSGCLVLENCDFTNNALCKREGDGEADACIEVTGHSAQPIIRRCAIHDAAEFGIIVNQRGRGLIEDCDIFANEQVGIGVASGADPMVRRCKVRDGGWLGAAVAENGKGKFEDCDFFGNRESGLFVMSGGDPVVRRCKLRDGKGSGAAVGGQSKGRFENCEVFGNTTAGIVVADGGDPTVRRCILRDGKRFGAVFTGMAKGLFEDCEIFGNEHSAVRIDTSSDPMLRRCKLRDGKGEVVSITDDGKGTLEDCEIIGIQDSGLAILRGADPVVRRCKVGDGKGQGVQIVEGGKGTLEDCDIFGNRVGLWVSTSGDPVVRRCTLRDGQSSGLLICDGGKGTFEDCEVFRNKHAGVSVSTGGDPVVRRCCLRDGKSNGALVYDGGKGAFEECDIFGHPNEAVCVGPGGDPVFRKCRLHGGKSMGLLVAEGTGTFEGCEFFQNEGGGIGVIKKGAPVVRDCRIHDNKRFGVMILADASGTFENCELWSNDGGNLEISPGCRPHLAGNRER